MARKTASETPQKPQGKDDSQKKKGVKKKYYPSKRWTFTLHGGTDDQKKRLIKMFDDDLFTFAIFSKETGEHSIHPHFQGYFELSKKKLTKELFEAALGNKSTHLEAATRNKETNVAYVHGMDKAYEIGWIQYSKGEYEKPHGYSDYSVKFMENFKPRSFQKMMLDIVDENKVDDRSIYWFWEPTGNVGKTSLGRVLHRLHGAMYLRGSSGDMKHACTMYREYVNKDPTIIVIDIARGADATTDLHQGIEDLKNGLFFSGKYQSTMIDAKVPPHVFVLANVPPSLKTHSGDRWKVFRIHSKTYHGYLQTRDEVNEDYERYVIKGPLEGTDDGDTFDSSPSP